jgi:hypothetical protein
MTTTCGVAVEYARISNNETACEDEFFADIRAVCGFEVKHTPILEDASVPSFFASTMTTLAHFMMGTLAMLLA